MNNSSKKVSDAITITSPSGVDPRKAQKGLSVSQVRAGMKRNKNNKKMQNAGMSKSSKDSYGYESTKRTMKDAISKKKKSLSDDVKAKYKDQNTRRAGRAQCGGKIKCKGGKMRKGAIMYQAGGALSAAQKMGMAQMGADTAAQIGGMILDYRKNKVQEKELAKKNLEDKKKAYQQGVMQQSKNAIAQNKAKSTLPPPKQPSNGLSQNSQVMAPPKQPMPAPQPMATPTPQTMMPTIQGAAQGAAQGAMQRSMQQPAPRNMPQQHPIGGYQQRRMYNLGGILAKLK